MHPIEILERYWNYTSFKPFQEDIINAVIKKEDTFALLPTGGGKSLCYQIPALHFDGLCIVVSPLIALMQNQVNDLKRKGIKAIALTSGMSFKDLDMALDNAIYGKYKFLYLSPERLDQHLVKERIQQMKVSLIAVDEAHCISQWGYDFRPAYLNIAKLRNWHPTATCIALTATAKSEIITDIMTRLDFISPKVFQGSFKRDNIALLVTKTEDKWYHLSQFLDASLGSSIVYVRTRKASKELSKQLNEAGYLSSFFHGGLSNEEKTNRLNDWISNRTATMVATTAFGMGINKQDVDTVIHYNLPESLESYYQEVGRAGRNGLPARAILLHKPIDKELLHKQFIGNLPSIEDVKFLYKKLCNFFQIAYGERVETAFQFNFKTFCATYKLRGKLTYNCLEILDRNGIIDLDQKFNFNTQIQFITNNHSLFTYLERHNDLALIVKTLLRTYGGIFDYDTKVNLDLIIKKLRISEKHLISTLKQLEKDQVISLKLANNDSEITFLKPREDDLTINPFASFINNQAQIKKDQVASVIRYVENTSKCRQIQVLTYFGEEINANCGICSVCEKKETPLATNTALNALILDTIRFKSLSSRELSASLDFNTEDILKALQELLEDDKITITKSNKYKCKTR
ncbi:RecQ family ATP-dependent DNA helicase [Winogradskyella aurantiaca]|uniref:RecQ family ATP-dependent DNA helicase n=1 Tax=Winogradskyella aurantiaca TaxID=2219558 RepID=UPI000E1C7EAC|nr:RecQ family ATP-dependent DNA helicase [Winogradskyella aurantiaca]